MCGGVQHVITIHRKGGMPVPRRAVRIEPDHQITAPDIRSLDRATQFGLLVGIARPCPATGVEGLLNEAAAVGGP